jgi:hypothetical protein
VLSKIAYSINAIPNNAFSTIAWYRGRHARARRRTRGAEGTFTIYYIYYIYYDFPPFWERRSAALVLEENTHLEFIILIIFTSVCKCIAQGRVYKCKGYM